MKKVSIIIICREKSKGLDNVIHNWIIQDYPKKEIIVVMPESGKELRKKHPRIKFMKDKGKGPSSARNIGFSKSTGQVILFSDADKNSKKVRSRKILENRISPFNEKNVDYVYADYTPKITGNIINDAVNIKDFGIKNRATKHLPTAYNKNILGKKPFDEKLEYGEDRKLASDTTSKSSNYGISRKPLECDSSIDSWKSFFDRYKWYGRTIKKYMKKTRNYKPIINMIVGIIFISLLFTPSIIPLIIILFFYYRQRNVFSYCIKKNGLIAYLLSPFFTMISYLIITIFFIKSLI